MTTLSRILATLRAKRSAYATTKRQSTRLHVESLDPRVVPALSPGLLNHIGHDYVNFVSPISLTNKVITINGDNGADDALVTIDTHGTATLSDDEVVASVYRSGQSFEQRFKLYFRNTVIPQVTKIIYNGGDGNDVFTNLTNIPSVAFGGAGGDALYGGSGNDQLFGGSGNDYIHGGDGDDIIFGDDGNDLIFGDGGKDIIFGGANDDTIYVGDSAHVDAGDGNDLVYAGNNCIVQGGNGNDTIYAGDFNTVFGDFQKRGVGDDTIYVGDDSNVRGGNGNDVIHAQSSCDLFGDFDNGGSGNDSIYAASGDNIIHGGDGDDLIAGGSGNDSIDGGRGNDALYGNDGNDTIRGGDGTDYIDGGTGNDLLRGGSGNDLIHGGLGNDSINGDDDNDSLYGDEGNDLIYGADGDDNIYGGANNDWLFGGDGTDVINGGSGNDVLCGGHVNFNENKFSTMPDFGEWGDRNFDYFFGDDGADTFLVSDVYAFFSLDDVVDSAAGDSEFDYYGPPLPSFIPAGFYPGDQITSAGHLDTTDGMHEFPVGSFNGFSSVSAFAPSTDQLSAKASRTVELGGRLLTDGSFALANAADPDAQSLSATATFQLLNKSGMHAVRISLDLHVELSKVVDGVNWTADIELTGPVTMTHVGGKVKLSGSLHAIGEVTSVLGTKSVDLSTSISGNEVVLGLPVLGTETIHLA